MKRIVAIALFGIASMFTIGRASAQVSRVQATVPFDFTVGGHMLPASTYTITSPRHGLIELQSVDRHSHAFVLARQADRRQAIDGKLVFAKNDQHYVLRQVLCPGALMNVDLLNPRTEKKSSRESGSSLGEVMGKTKGETTLIAAR